MLKRKIFKPAFIAAGIIVLAACLYTYTRTGNATDTEADAPAAAEGAEDSLLQVLNSALPEGNAIEASRTDDFNKDNKPEMFGLVNNGKENEPGTSASQVWYADETGAKMIFEGSIYFDTAAIWDVGSQKLFYAEEGYGGSGSLSHVWSVNEDGPYELEHAGEALEYAENLQFYTYPGAFDLSPDGTGHTWKRYYLYFDAATGTFKEYGGIPVSIEELLKFKGASEIVEELDRKAYIITDIFYRENGIININYSDGKYNLNLTLNVLEDTVSIAAPGSIENPDYDRGGIYKAAVFEDIATYPEKLNY